MRYRITLTWIGPKPGPRNKKATYIIDLSPIDTVEKAIAAALLIAPRCDPDVDDTKHWKVTEAWIHVDIPKSEEIIEGS